MPLEMLTLQNDDNDDYGFLERENHMFERFVNVKNKKIL